MFDEKRVSVVDQRRLPFGSSFHEVFAGAREVFRLSTLIPFRRFSGELAGPHGKSLKMPLAGTRDFAEMDPCFPDNTLNSLYFTQSKKFEDGRRQQVLLAIFKIPSFPAFL